MAKPLNLHIRESIKEIRRIQRSTDSSLILKRMEVLIILKQFESKGGISKRDLSIKTGINHNSIVKWRQMYLKDGIDSLITHKRIGYKKNILSLPQHKGIEKKLRDAKNPIRGYTELVQWVKETYNVVIKYTTLNEYCKRHFQSKIKVARKSHIKKDESLVESLKKTSAKRY